MRRDDFSRRLRCASTGYVTRQPDLSRLHPGRARDQRQSVASMPGVERVSVDLLLPVAEDCVKLGIPVIALFPMIDPSLKTPDGIEATNAEGLMPRAVRAAARPLPRARRAHLDVALGPYTSHGQDWRCSMTTAA
ncbi:hypothetical protein ACTMU2_34615 [Cupriavidus basilensis]